MQYISGLIRKAVNEYNMIEDGDRIAVGVSGGKDSVALLAGLAKYKTYAEMNFDIVAITLDPCFNGVETDYTPIEELCKSLNVEYHVKRTEIGKIIFDIRKETNPCSLCARMRRGALHDLTNEYGCTKIALGHHYDDAVETFFLNLFNEGRIGCFSPVSYLSRKDTTMIRPLIMVEEADVISAIKRNNLPVVKSKCPADGTTKRQQMKEWIAQRCEQDRSFKKKIYGAMKRAHISQW